MSPAVATAAWVWALLLGACLGSFLNVVVARLPAGQSIARPRSRCPRCLASIAWYDNVPVLSWLLLRGRCRACRAPISPRYPLVELLGAGAAGLALWRHGLGGAAAAELALVLCLLALALIDLDTWLLPNVLTWPLLGAGLLASAAELGAAPSLAQSVLGAAVGAGLFAAIAVVGERLLHREAMGWGDVWLLAGLGAWLGVKALLPVVLLASLQGTVVGLALAALGRLPKGAAGERAIRSRAGPAGEGEPDDWVPPRNAVPFGPFLVAAGLEWLYLSDQLVRLVPALQPFR